MRITSFATGLLALTRSWLASLWPVQLRSASEDTDKGFTIDPDG